MRAVVKHSRFKKIAFPFFLVSFSIDPSALLALGKARKLVMRRRWFILMNQRLSFCGSSDSDDLVYFQRVPASKGAPRGDFQRAPPRSDKLLSCSTVTQHALSFLALFRGSAGLRLR